MNILILSCNTGEGHNAAGKAVKEKAEERGHQACMIDIMGLAGEKVSKAVGGGYVNIARSTPWFFGLLYQLGLLISSRRFKSPVYFANSLMAKYLESYLAANETDIIVAPHLYPAETLTFMKRRNRLKQKTVAIATDYTCIPFWEETECDFYILPHKDCVEEFCKRGIPREKLLPLGIPVCGEFEAPADKTEVRKKLKLPQTGNIYLIMSGSMGFGKVKLFSRELVKVIGKEDYIVIICGNNEKLRNSLQKQFQNHPKVRITGFTKHVADYMAACDVVYTKPGGLSSTEALARGLPIIHTAPIPGCETKNRNFFRKRGMAVSASGFAMQIYKGKVLTENENKRLKMITCQRENACPEAALHLIELLESIAAK